MAIEVKHATESVAGPYTPEGELGPAEWNELHDLAGDAETLLYFDAEGDPTGVELDEDFFDIDGGVLTFVGETGGDPVPGQWVEVSRAEADEDTIIDFTGIDDSADEWEVRGFFGISGSSSAGQIRVSSDNGSTFIGTSASYHNFAMFRKPGTVGGAPDYYSEEEMFASRYLGDRIDFMGYWDGAGSACNVVINISVPHISDRWMIKCESAQIAPFMDAGASWESSCGRLVADTAINAIRIFGNTMTGTFVLYKRVKA